MRTVLYVDDDPDDLFLFTSAAKKAGVRFRLKTALGGVEAINVLSASTDSVAAEQGIVPCFVLLDIKMPTKDGFEVLHWIRHHEQLRSLTVALYSSSVIPADVDRGYLEGADYFIAKPPGLIGMLSIANVIDLCVSEVPPDCAALKQLSLPSGQASGPA